MQDVWPDGQRARHIEHPEHRGQLHEDDRHRPRHRAGARGLRQRLKSAYTPARDVVHTIAEPGGTKTQLINKPGKLALTFAWNTKTNAKQYKVQVSRHAGLRRSRSSTTTTDQSSYTPVLTQQDFIDGGAMYWRVAVVDPDGNVGRVQQGQEVHAPGAHAGASHGPAGARAARPVVIVTVLNAKGKPIKGAAVKLARRRRQDRGAQRRTRRASSTFSVKPTRTGNLTATATKKLFKVGTAVAQIS